MYQNNIEIGRMFVESQKNRRISDLQGDGKTSSAIIRELMDSAKINQKALSVFLDCKPQSLANKFIRNSFSLDDFIIAAFACDYALLLHNKKTGVDKELTPEIFFQSKNPETLARINRLKKEKRMNRITELRKELKELEALETEE